jgi:hypothetical protein
MAAQEKSDWPRKIITPESTSTTAYGGCLNPLISFRFAGFSWPTAARAASTSGWTPESSSSTSDFLVSMIF